MSPVYFSLLGPLTVLTSDGRPVDIPEAKIRALLAHLLVHAGRPVSTDRLVDHLWGDHPPRNPAGALQTKVSRLRRALGRAEPGAEALVESRPPGYLLRVGADDTDAGRFAALVASAYGTGDPAARARLLTEALALWTGEAYAGLTDGGAEAGEGADAVRNAAHRLEEERLTALEALAETRLELGEHHALVGELGELTARNPLRERLRAAHLRALYRAGRQAEALAAYADLRERLADELGVDPGPELAALHTAILRQDPELSPPGPGTPDLPVPAPATVVAAPPQASPPAAPGQLTDLVGRAAALAAVRGLLATHRLVTLTGPGGVGKTRLAEETAARLTAPGRPDGPAEDVRFVGLAASGDVGEQVSAALGIREDGGLGLEDALRSRRMLLVLDNCEHVVDAVADLTHRLLATAPGLRVLATSREPLGVPGEAVWTVPPLEQADAERLFAARAAAAVPGFAVGPDNAEAVATLCRRLDRIPLALELAATRVRALGVHELAARLDDRFRLLAGGRRGVPPRQRTLRAVIDWSWELLGDDERAVLRRLAVHADGCTLEAAEAVCGHDRDALDPLVRLVDRSLVSVSGVSLSGVGGSDVGVSGVGVSDVGGSGVGGSGVGGTDGPAPRYRLAESVAAYARERLAEAGETEAVSLRHHAYYTALAERAAPGLHGPDQQRWLEHLDRETANLRAALDHAVRRREAPDALRLAVALTWYWFLRGRLGEAVRSLAQCLALTDGAPADLRRRAAARHAGFTVLAGAHAPEPDGADDRSRWFLGHALLHSGGDLARSEDLVERALAGFRADGDRWGVAAATGTRAWQALLRGDLDAVRVHGEESLALFGELGDRWGLLSTTYPMAALAEITGAYERAARLHREGLRLAEELGFRTAAADRLTGLGRLALLTGDFRDAERLHERAQRLAAEEGYTAGEVHAEMGLALGARREGRLDRAETYLRKALDWHRGVAFGPGPALLLAELGFVAEQRGDGPAALALHREGLAAARSAGDPRALALAFEGLGGAHALTGRPSRAARHHGAA
ncbi:BTAD domain-containing putative transcriptional regulator, partial [Streptomyces sp. NPDC045431]|uniref:BTAD domain-containing putative transcriptional regulator n=1 Tax=Streptomyces sp. NPDC045431 TaxID=3155613 RepID=UPI003409A19B